MYVKVVTEGGQKEETFPCRHWATAFRPSDGGYDIEITLDDSTMVHRSLQQEGDTAYAMGPDGRTFDRKGLKKG